MLTKKLVASASTVHSTAGLALQVNKAKHESIFIQKFIASPLPGANVTLNAQF